MKLGIMLLALALAFSIGVIAPSPGVRASSNMPAWTVGDYWAYNATDLTTLPGFSGYGTQRLDTVGTETVALSNASYACYKLNVFTNTTITYGSTTISISSTGHEWHRTSDLALVKQDQSISFGSVSATVTTTFNPPAAIHWPLTNGDTWSAAYKETLLEVEGSLTLTSVINVTAAYRVQPDIALSVPAGTFNATPLLETGMDGSTNTSYWSASVGNYIRLASYDAALQPVTALQLTSYRYQGGSTGSAGFLGLSLVIWGVILVVIAAAAVAAVLVLRRRGKGPAAVPPMQPPIPPAQPPQGGGPMPPPPPPSP